MKDINDNRMIDYEHGDEDEDVDENTQAKTSNPQYCKIIQNFHFHYFPIHAFCTHTRSLLCHVCLTLEE